MSRPVLDLRIRLRTGSRPGPEAPLLRVNGVEIPLHRVRGGTGPGETFEGGFFLATIVERLALAGPASGVWDLDCMEIEIEDPGWGVVPARLGPLALAAGGEADLLPAGGVEV